MSTKKGATRLVELVQPTGAEKVLVSEIPELLATALYPEIPENTPQRVDDIAKVSSRQTSGERINLGIKREPPGEQFQRPTGYCRLQIVPSRKRSPLPISPDQLIYVQVSDNAVLPLDDSDKKKLAAVWRKLPALDFPIDETAWQKYLLADQNDVSEPWRSWRRNWCLCMKVVNPFAERQISWSASLAECTELVREAVEQKKIIPRSPVTGLPISLSQSQRVSDCFITADDLNRYVDDLEMRGITEISSPQENEAQHATRTIHKLPSISKDGRLFRRSPFR